MTTPDLLTSSAHELSALFAARKLTSEDLVGQYFAQIARHNHDGMNIRAIITVADHESTLQLARELDYEREEKGPRGPLHGIPVLIKAGALKCTVLHADPSGRTFSSPQV